MAINRYHISFRSKKGRKHTIKLDDKIGAEMLFEQTSKENPGQVEMLDQETKEIRVNNFFH